MNEEKLSREEAFTFLRDILKIKDPERKWKEEKKLDFLQLILNKWFEFVPFQNAYQICLTKKESRLATVQQIIDWHKKGKGGICLFNAIFTSLLLSALDYQVDLSSGGAFLPNDHAFLVLQNVQQEGDSYLVDTGSGWPVFQPVRLDTLPTSLASCHVYSNSFFEYTYIKEGDLVVRYHRKGDYVEMPRPKDQNGWRRVSESDLRPVDLSFFYSSDASILSTVLDVTKNNLTRNLIAVRYPDQKASIIKNSVTIEDVNGERVTTKSAKDKEQLLDEYKSLFPMLDVEKVGEAIDFVRENIEKWGTGDPKESFFQ